MTVWNAYTGEQKTDYGLPEAKANRGIASKENKKIFELMEMFKIMTVVMLILCVYLPKLIRRYT